MKLRKLLDTLTSVRGLTSEEKGECSVTRYVFDFFSFFFFVANYAESRLSQGNLNQPDVAFCFMSAAIS
jgi:hypothetical protein